MKITCCCFIALLNHAQNYAKALRPFPYIEMDTSKITYTYKQAGELKILADVYPAAGINRPVVVWIHGGALIMGNREEIPGWLLEACSRNEYVLVSFDYRLAPETRLPLIIEDVEDAFIGYVRRARSCFTLTLAG